MNLTNHRNFWPSCFVLVILLAFFLFRPLNSPQYRLIVADGLGYYVYLPAQFIYDDKNLDFKWFDDVYNKYYQNPPFVKPTQNFLVQYKDKLINLYYPGQSLLQAPFFFLAHLTAKLIHIPADGFSQPYQIAMGLSALFYTLLGLLFCYKLSFNLSGDRNISLLALVIIFFACNLFTYSIYNGCYTHCYSFAFISLSLYFAERLFNKGGNQLTNFLLLALSSLVVVSLRPMNALLLLSTLYFYKPIPLKLLFTLSKNYLVLGVIFLMLIIVALYTMSIIHTQTGLWLANTYTIGQFHFSEWVHVWDNFFGFQTGILWYTPILFICFIPILFSLKQPRVLFLVLPILISIILYSLWWYWNIVSRTLVDFSGILVVLFTLLLMNYKKSAKAYRYILLASLLCIPFFQLKAYQLRNGILSSNYTYWRYYVKHFLKIGHVDVFPVNPKTVLSQQAYFSDFENENKTTEKNKYEGNKSATLNSELEFAATKTFSVPEFYSRVGYKKIKASFWFFRSEEMKNVHLVFTFKNHDSTLIYQPFYINQSTPSGKWDYKEFGMDFPEKPGGLTQLAVYFWNPDKKNEAFIDNFKLEFFRTDGSDEIMPLDN